jgi:hypothetical protein
MSTRVPALVPALTGAIATVATMLLVGWPDSPVLAGPADVAAVVALIAISVLLLAGAATAGRRRTPVPRRPAAGSPIRRLHPPAAVVQSASCRRAA